MGQKNLCRKFVWVKKLFGQEKIGLKKFGSKKFAGQKNLFRNFFGMNKIWVGNLFWPNSVLLQKKIGSKKFWAEKIWVKKNLGQKNVWVHESSSWVKIGLHTENQLPGWSGSGLKFFRWWVGGLHTHNLVKPTSTWLWLSWVLTKSTQTRSINLVLAL